MKPFTNRSRSKTLENSCKKNFMMRLDDNEVKKRQIMEINEQNMYNYNFQPLITPRSTAIMNNKKIIQRNLKIQSDIQVQNLVENLSQEISKEKNNNSQMITKSSKMYDHIKENQPRLKDMPNTKLSEGKKDKGTKNVKNNSKNSKTAGYDPKTRPQNQKEVDIRGQYDVKKEATDTVINKIKPSKEREKSNKLLQAQEVKRERSRYLHESNSKLMKMLSQETDRLIIPYNRTSIRTEKENQSDTKMSKSFTKAKEELKQSKQKYINKQIDHYTKNIFFQGIKNDDEPSEQSPNHTVQDKKDSRRGSFNMQKESKLSRARLMRNPKDIMVADKVGFSYNLYDKYSVV